MRAAAIVLCGAALLVRAAPAQAAGERGTVWRVVKAVHTSSAEYRSPDAMGSASMRWRLAPPTSTAPNRMTVGASGPLIVGYGVVNVRGDVAAVSTTDRGTCRMAASTGSTEYPYDVPTPITLNLSAHPAGGLQVALAARYATLGSGSFGSECTLRQLEPPSDKVTKVIRIPAKALRRKKLTLTFDGAGGGALDAYRWSTRIELKRGR